MITNTILFPKHLANINSYRPWGEQGNRIVSLTDRLRSRKSKCWVGGQSKAQDGGESWARVSDTFLLLGGFWRQMGQVLLVLWVTKRLVTGLAGG